MKQFKELGIQIPSLGFIGDKIAIDWLLNRKIVVLDYKIGPSTQKAGTDCLTLQIEVNDQKRIVFSGSKNLMEAIKKVDKSDFPFEVTIIRDGKTTKFS